MDALRHFYIVQALFPGLTVGKILTAISLHVISCLLQALFPGLTVGNILTVISLLVITYYLQALFPDLTVGNILTVISLLVISCYIDSWVSSVPFYITGLYMMFAPQYRSRECKRMVRQKFYDAFVSSSALG